MAHFRLVPFSQLANSVMSCSQENDFTDTLAQMVADQLPHFADLLKAGLSQQVNSRSIHSYLFIAAALLAAAAYQTYQTLQQQVSLYSHALIATRTALKASTCRNSPLLHYSCPAAHPVHAVCYHCTLELGVMLQHTCYNIHLLDTRPWRAGEAKSASEQCRHARRLASNMQSLEPVGSHATMDPLCCWPGG